MARLRSLASAPPAPAVKLDESVLLVEREVLKIGLQLPGVAGPHFDTLTEETFLLPAHRALRRAISDAGGNAGRAAARA